MQNVVDNIRISGEPHSFYSWLPEVLEISLHGFPKIKRIIIDQSRSFSYNQIYSFSNRYDPVANKVILLSIGYNSSVKLLSKAVNGKAINRP